MAICITSFKERLKRIALSKWRSSNSTSTETKRVLQNTDRETAKLLRSIGEINGLQSLADQA
jgi:ribosomal protein S2